MSMMGQRCHLLSHHLLPTLRKVVLGLQEVEVEQQLVER
jgi:hypothetical protein